MDSNNNYSSIEAEGVPREFDAEGVVDGFGEAPPVQGDEPEAQSAPQNSLMGAVLRSDPTPPPAPPDPKTFVQAPCSYSATQSEKAVLNNGSLQYTVTDFVLPGRNGFDLAITRRYDSYEANQMDLGYYMGGTSYQSGVRENIHNEYTYGLGLGWSFVLPAFEAVYHNDDTSDEQNRAFLHLDDGRNLECEYEHTPMLKDYTMKDVLVEKISGQLNHPNHPLVKDYDFMVTHKDGRWDYFKTVRDLTPQRTLFTLVGRRDRFGNTMLFTMYPYGGMEIIDSWGRSVHLVKDGDTMTWTLPDRSTIAYTVDQGWPKQLTAVRDQAGRVTEFSYHPLNEYKAVCRVANEEYGDYGYPEVPYLLLKEITHPTGAKTQFNFGDPNDPMELKLNDYGGFKRFYLLRGRSDVAGDREYGNIRYNYNPADDRKYLQTAWVERLFGVSEQHSFNDKNLLTESRVHHSGVLRELGAFTYGENKEGNDYKLLISEKRQKYDETGTLSFEKQTVTTYTDDKRANVRQVDEMWPEDPSLNQQTTFQYDDLYSVMTEKVCHKNWTTLLMERYQLIDRKAVEYKLVLENGALRQKTQYLYGGGWNDGWCVVEERNFYSSTDYRRKTYGYDASQHTHAPVSIETHDMQDAEGNALAPVREEYRYDACGRLVGKTDPNGNSTDYAYDGLGRLVRETHPPVDGVRASAAWVYDDSNNHLTAIDENGYRTRTEYTPLGQPLREVLVSAGGPEDKDVKLSEKSYDAALRVTGEDIYDGYGGVRRRVDYSYDSYDRVVRQSVPQTGYTETHRYFDVWVDGEDGIKKTRHEKTVAGSAGAPDVVSAEASDQAGRQVKSWLGGVRTSLSAYDKVGNKISETDALGNVTRYTCDFAGRTLETVRTVSGRSVRTHVVYDMLGLKVESYDAKNQRTDYTYDAAGRLLRQLSPFAGTRAESRWAYDAAGNLRHHRVNRGDVWRVTEYRYDARGRQTDVLLYEDEAGTKYSRTVTVYDNLGNKLEVRTGLTEATNDYAAVKYSYDRFGNVVQSTDALGQAERHIYSPKGLPVNKTDRNGSVTQFTHDAMERLVETKVVANTKNGPVTTTRRHSYAKNGQKLTDVSTEARAGEGAVTLAIGYEYDGRGQLVTQRDPGGVVKTYTHDAAGRRQTFRLVKDGTEQLNLHYSYDEAGRLVAVRRGGESGAVVAEYTYDICGNRTKLRYPEADTETNYFYSPGNLITWMESRTGGTVLQTSHYDYYFDGNRKSQIVDDVSTRYTYDLLGRLTGEERADSPKTTYTYDRFQNRASMTVEDHKTAVTSYTYDRNNRLLQQVTAEGRAKETLYYTYDANGNQLTRQWEKVQPHAKSVPVGAVKFVRDGEKGVATYEERRYNGANELIGLENEQWWLKYQYRPDGLRYSKTKRSPRKHGWSTATHHWDGQNIVLETNEAGQVKSRFLRGSDLLCQLIDGETYFYLHNAHGDVTQRVSQSGNPGPKYVYDAFGVQRTDDETDPNPFRYCGEYFDGETREVYLRARYYDPSTGRFTSEDPTQLEVNWYTYCANNPIIHIDPEGLKSKPVKGKDVSARKVYYPEKKVTYRNVVGSRNRQTIDKVASPSPSQNRSGGSTDNGLLPQAGPRLAEMPSIAPLNLPINSMMDGIQSAFGSSRSIVNRFRNRSENIDYTTSTGISVSGSIGPSSLGIQIGRARDMRGNRVTQITISPNIVLDSSPFSSAPTGNISVYKTRTNAPTVNELTELGLQSGISISSYIPPVPIPITASSDLVVMPDPEHETAYYGVTMAAGISSQAGADVHVGTPYTINVPYTNYNIYDVYDACYDLVMGW